MSKKRKQRQLEDDLDPVNVAQKRRRQYSEQDAKLAKIYDDLTNEVKDTRVAAAIALLNVLQEDRSILDKIVVRLIRGLCSSRKAARSGFFIALTEVLQDAKPDADGIIDQITEETKREGQTAAQEKRDHLFGRMFGYRAVIQSSLVFSQKASIDVWKRLLDLMLEIPEATPILREECFMSLYATVEQLGRQSLAQDYAEVMLQKLCDHKVAQTPGGVAIWLEIHDRFPELKLPRGIWHNDDPLDKKEWSRLANVMKETNPESINPEADEGAAKLKGQKARSGSHRALPSFAWDVIFEHSLKRPPDKRERRMPRKSMFSKLWNAIVDQSLFAASASPERKALGFQVLTKLIAKGPADVFPAIFSKNIMNCIMNQRSNQERFLHDAAKAPLDALRSKLKHDSLATTRSLGALLGEYGNVNFDHLTKTKTIESIMTTSGSESLIDAILSFERLICQPKTDDERAAEASRRILADHLLSAVRSCCAKGTSEADTSDTMVFLESVIRLFVRFGYCWNNEGNDATLKPYPPISATSKSVFRSRLSSCLAHILSAGLDKDCSLPYYVIRAINWPLACVGPGFEATFEADKGIKKQAERAWKTLRSIHSDLDASSGRSDRVAPLRAISLLYSLTLLQVYDGDADAVGMLADIETCHDQIIKHTSGGQDAMTLLMEVVLSFLARPSVLFRRLAEQVFVAFASEVNAECLKSLTEVLCKPESVSGQRDLFESEDDAIASEGGSSLDEVSDVEMMDNGSKSSSENASSSEGDGKETPEDSDVEDGSGCESNTDQEDSAELKKFDQLLAEALKSQPANPTMPNGEESSSDEDMDDEQMMALEPHLTKIFEERKKSSTKKTEQRDAKETVVNFKSRILDLLTIYVKQQHANPIAMSIILPLLFLIRTTNTKHLSEKAFNLLKTYFDACKGGKGLPSPPLQSTVDLLSDVHEEFMKSVSKIHVSACSRSSLFLIKVLLGLDQKHYREAARRYEETQVRWYEKPKSKVTGSFFTEWTSWSIATTKYT